MKDALGHGSDAHNSGIDKATEIGAAHQKMLSAVTDYDRKQQAQADRANQKRPGSGYYNHYALPQYLGRVAEAHESMKSGMSVKDAIDTHFNDRLATALHKATGSGGDARRSELGLGTKVTTPNYAKPAAMRRQAKMRSYP